MTADMINAWALVGGAAALSLSGVGSALGAGAAGSSAVGAWKKCYVQKKPAPFLLAAFVGAPLSQTIYGFILMLIIQGKAKAISEAVVAGTAVTANWPLLLGAGIFAGLGMGFSAWMQGKAAAGASDAFAETGEGFTNYLIVLGIIETVALFIMVFTLMLVQGA